MLSRQHYDYSFWKNDYNDFTCRKKKKLMEQNACLMHQRGTYGVPLNFKEDSY